MLDPKWIRTEPENLVELLHRRNFRIDLEQLVSLDNRRREIQVLTESLQNDRNSKSKLIGKAKSSGEDVSLLMQEVGQINIALEEQKLQLAELQAAFQKLMLEIPNLPLDGVPAGLDESSNQTISTWGQPREFHFPVQDHVSIGESLSDKLDFAAATKITGSRFVVMNGALARLHRALIQFMLDLHTTEHYYREVCVPYIVNGKSLQGTGQLPKFEADLFRLTGEQDYYLVPTAEVPVTNLVRDEILDADALPLRFVAHTPCFRSEAGSYGKDTRGMIRQHQFEKVELVQIVRSVDSAQALEQLTSHAETVLQRLQLPYRKIALCAGDLGFASAMTYDLEVWLPSQACYREISSCSNCTDFQARRMQARWRNPVTGKPELVHTLNGSGLAVGRTLVAILENFQQEDGSVVLPAVLQPYMGGQSILR